VGKPRTIIEVLATEMLSEITFREWKVSAFHYRKLLTAVLITRMVNIHAEQQTKSATATKREGQF
jgi:hypothetical protein